MAGSRPPRRNPLYDEHPAFAHLAQIITNLPTTTGKSLEEWVSLVRASASVDDKGRREWLKREHGLGMTTINVIIDEAAGRIEPYEPDAYVEAMFAGPKAGLRPIYDRLLEVGKGMGPDVRVCPCKTIVPFYRKHVFAEIKPSTRTRIDFGYALGATEPVGRLTLTGGLAKGDRITHRIAITQISDIDAEVERWLRIAYDRDG